MRKLLLLLTAALAASGIALLWGDVGEGAPAWRKTLALAHIWGGFFFLVIFPLYAWDHVRANRGWLRVWAAVTVSGVTQLAGGALLIVTGVILLAYQSQAGGTIRWVHHVLTYALLAALALHFASRKH